LLLACAAGALWARVARLVADGWLLQRVAFLGDTSDRVWLTLVSWTGLLPASAASVMVCAFEPLREKPWAETLVSSALGAAVVLVTTWALARVSGSVRVWATLATLGLVAIAATGLARQVSQVERAEQAFFAMLSGVDVAYRDERCVRSAEAFADKFPDSRWRGEALRIVAMNHEISGHWEQAASAWARFDALFAGSGLPGEAYAEYSLARCAERLNRLDESAAHYRAAIAIIRARADGIQGWIPVEAAKRLAAVERRTGLVASSYRWEQQAQASQDACSIE